MALITGAAQGIGQAIAVALAERGAQVIVTDLTPPHRTVERIGPAAHAFQLDVTQEEDWRSVSVESRDVGDVDIVVNNAGYFPNRSIDELDLLTWRKTMATNLDAQFLSAKSFLPAIGPFGCRVRQFHATIRSRIGPASRGQTTCRAGRSQEASAHKTQETPPAGPNGRAVYLVSKAGKPCVLRPDDARMLSRWFEVSPYRPGRSERADDPKSRIDRHGRGMGPCDGTLAVP